MITSRSRRWGGRWVETAPLRTDFIYNTGFPFGTNDGPLWAGRGLTAAVEMAASTGWGPVSLVLAPNAFWTENRSFPLAEPIPGTEYPFSDPLHARQIDLPQRFGEKSYARFDPGQSTLRVDAFGGAIGLSTANGWWGPMRDFPYLLGNNAPGFLHVFVGSSTPIDVWGGRVHGRVVYGRLQQSAFSPVDTGHSDRFASGFAVVAEPILFPGLEVGFARFFHSKWPDGGLTEHHFTHLFETFIKASIRRRFEASGPNNQSLDNQLASAFARWALPRSNAEVYAEYGREDHNWDTRDLTVEPDHSASYGVGFRKLWGDAAAPRSLWFELINIQSSPIARHRPQGGSYYHSGTRQGHTQLGQLLGSGIGAGNVAGGTLGLERMDVRGATRLSWTRLVTLDRTVGGDNSSNAQYALRVERLLLGRRHQRRVGVTLVSELNRNLTTSSGFNLRLDTSWSWF